MDGVSRFAYSPPRHPFQAWLCDRLEARGHRGALSELHRIISIENGAPLAAALSDETVDRGFRSIAHRLVAEVIAPELDFVPFVQVGGYVRLHLPGEPEGTGFHSDTALGHGEDEQNLWIALTVATLWIVPRSAGLTICDGVESMARRAAIPITLEAGEGLRFPAGQIHGVLANTGDRTQVTIDVRITPRINPHAVLGCRFEALSAVPPEP